MKLLKSLPSPFLFFCDVATCSGSSCEPYNPNVVFYGGCTNRSQPHSSSPALQPVGVAVLSGPRRVSLSIWYGKCPCYLAVNMRSTGAALWERLANRGRTLPKLSLKYIFYFLNRLFKAQEQCDYLYQFPQEDSKTSVQCFTLHGTVALSKILL